MDYRTGTGQESFEDLEERRQQKLKGTKTRSVSSSSEQNLSGPAFAGLGVLPAPSYLHPPLSAFEDALRNAWVKGMPEEVYNEVASVRNPYVKGSLCSALNGYNIDPNTFRKVLEDAAGGGIVATMKWLLGHPNAIELDRGFVSRVLTGGNKAVLELLLQYQPDIVRNYDAQALGIAAIEGREEILQLLLEYGLDVNARAGPFQFTALHKAARVDCLGRLGTPSLGIVKILLRFGADPSLKDGEGRTARDLAKRRGNLAVDLCLFQAETTWAGQGTALDTMPARGASLSENSVKVKVEELSKKWTKLSIITDGKGAIDSLEPTKDDSIPDTKHWQQIPPASQPTVDMSGRSQALSIRDAIGVEEELDCQDDHEPIDKLSAMDCDSLLDECIDGAKGGEGSQCSEVEHEGVSETIESSDPPSIDATDSMEDEAEGCDFSATMSLEMQHILGVLMTEFYAIHANWGGEMQDGENDSIQSQQRISSSRYDHRPSSSSYGHSALNSSGRLGRSKRLAPDQNSDDEDRDEDGKKGLKRQKDSKNEEFTLLFACPYYKRDPAAHCKIGSCTGPGFRSVTRVKYV
jgi:hypothetical protein